MKNNTKEIEAALLKIEKMFGKNSKKVKPNHCEEQERREIELKEDAELAHDRFWENEDKIKGW